MDKNDYLAIAIGTIRGMITGNVLGDLAYRVNTNKIPRTTQVQQGYIAPSMLKVRCEDLDENGEYETIMKVGDVDYLLREIDGKPTLLEYEVKPPQITPK